VAACALDAAPLGDGAFDHEQPKLTDPNVRLLPQRTGVDCSKSKSSSVPSKSAEFPKEMAVRPSQLRAAAAESALMIPAARALRNGYRQLKMPVIIVAGADDRFVEIEQSSTLQIPLLHSIPATGHMVHQTATAKIMSAIDTAAEAAPRLSFLKTASVDRHSRSTSPVSTSSPLLAALQAQPVPALWL
jgi:pimeloyl-ACP methyl ester carboxylesterase